MRNSLGSDCSFFVTNRPAIVSGRGDEMEPLALNLLLRKAYFLVLVISSCCISSTAEAYSLPNSGSFRFWSGGVSSGESGSPGSWKREEWRMIFEGPVMSEKYPLIAALSKTSFTTRVLYMLRWVEAAHPCVRPVSKASDVSLKAAFSRMPDYGKKSSNSNCFFM